MKVLPKRIAESRMLISFIAYSDDGGESGLGELDEPDEVVSMVDVADGGESDLGEVAAGNATKYQWEILTNQSKNLLRKMIRNTVGGLEFYNNTPHRRVNFTPAKSVPNGISVQNLASILMGVNVDPRAWKLLDKAARVSGVSGQSAQVIHKTRLSCDELGEVVSQLARLRSRLRTTVAKLGKKAKTEMSRLWERQIRILNSAIEKGNGVISRCADEEALKFVEAVSLSLLRPKFRTDSWPSLGEIFEGGEGDVLGTVVDSGSDERGPSSSRSLAARGIKLVRLGKISAAANVASKTCPVMWSDVVVENVRKMLPKRRDIPFDESVDVPDFPEVTGADPTILKNARKEVESCPRIASKGELMFLLKRVNLDAAPGPDGISFRVIWDLCFGTHSGADELCEAMIAMLNLFLKGLIPGVFTVPYMVPIGKGGDVTKIRPIGILSSFTRLASSVHATLLRPLVPLYHPQQFGVGVRGGAELMSSLMCQWLDRANFPPGKEHCILKLDIINAFNSMSREWMLKVIKVVAPGAYDYVHGLYGASVPILAAIGDTGLTMDEGGLQGDPLMPLLFCMAIGAAIRSQTLDGADFPLGAAILSFIDDCSILCDNVNINRCAKWLESFCLVGDTVGLSLNHAKTELILRHEYRKVVVPVEWNFFKKIYLDPVNDPRRGDTSKPLLPSGNGDCLEDLQKIPYAVFLGVPYSDCVWLRTAAIRQVVDKIRLDLEGFAGYGDPQCTLVVARSVLVARLGFLLRAIPPSITMGILEKHDQEFLDVMCAHLGLEEVELSVDCAQNDHIAAASLIRLPISKGGLGLRLGSFYAVPSFLAAMVAAVHTLVDLKLCKGKSFIEADLYARALFDLSLVDLSAKVCSIFAVKRGRLANGSGQGPSLDLTLSDNFDVNRFSSFQSDAFQGVVRSLRSPKCAVPYSNDSGMDGCLPSLLFPFNLAKRFNGTQRLLSNLLENKLLRFMKRKMAYSDFPLKHVENYLEQLGSKFARIPRGVLPTDSVKIPPLEFRGWLCAMYRSKILLRTPEDKELKSVLCRVCKKRVVVSDESDGFATHCIRCPRLSLRHDRLKRLCMLAAVDAGFEVEEEPTLSSLGIEDPRDVAREEEGDGGTGGRRRRRASVRVTNGQMRGDWSVCFEGEVHLYDISIKQIKHGVVDISEGLKKKAKEKEDKYRYVCQRAEVRFHPVILSAMGVAHSSVSEYLKKCGTAAISLGKIFNIKFHERRLASCLARETGRLYGRCFYGIRVH